MYNKHMTCRQKAVSRSSAYSLFQFSSQLLHTMLFHHISKSTTIHAALWVIGACLITLTSELTAQTSFGEYKDIFLHIGLRPLKVQQGDVLISYADESPNTDFITTRKVLQKGNNGFGIETGAEFGEWDSWHWEISVSGVFAQARRVALNLGAGYNFPLEDLRWIIRPAILLSAGSNTMDLGLMQNTSVYIQVNGQRFYEEIIEVTAGTFEVGLRPKFSGIYLLNDQFSLQAQVGYFIKVFNTQPRIGFSGLNEIGESVKVTESLSARNLLFSVNGIRNQTKLPFRTSGPFFMIGGALHF